MADSPKEEDNKSIFSELRDEHNKEMDSQNDPLARIKTEAFSKKSGSSAADADGGGCNSSSLLRASAEWWGEDGCCSAPCSEFSG
uniref:Uncharacterized protein n=1 Tax=Cucumis melo TaxID=3656 RepID=A0A9I9EHQ0_CUCME